MYIYRERYVLLFPYVLYFYIFIFYINGHGASRAFPALYFFTFQTPNLIICVVNCDEFSSKVINILLCWILFDPKAIIQSFSFC